MKLVPFRKMSRDGRFWPCPDAGSCYAGMQMQGFIDTDGEKNTPKECRVVFLNNRNPIPARISELTGEYKQYWISHPGLIGWDEPCDEPYLRSIFFDR